MRDHEDHLFKQTKGKMEELGSVYIVNKPQYYMRYGCNYANVTYWSINHLAVLCTEEMNCLHRKFWFLEVFAMIQTAPNRNFKSNLLKRTDVTVFIVDS